MYDARNLTTHGVIVGMTGSGKTGLSIALLEEAAIDGIPAVIIDPKGDLTNLLLQFPDLVAAEFAEWLNPDDARQKNLSVDEYAQQLSERWRQGLIDSKQTPDRAREMSQRHRLPHLHARQRGGPALSILRTFAAPKAKLPLEDLNQKINATATALLGLSGITADPMQSREHVLDRPVAQPRLEQRQGPRPAQPDQGDPDAVDPHRRRLQPGDVLPRQGALEVRLAAEQHAGLADVRHLDAGRAARPGQHALPQRPAATPDLLPAPISTTTSACSSRRCCWKRC